MSLVIRTREIDFNVPSGECRKDGMISCVSGVFTMEAI